MFLSYIKYRLKAQGKFRLHSPFVFNFYEEVLDKMTHENWRDELNNKLNSFLLSKKDVFLEDDDVIIKYDKKTYVLDLYKDGSNLITLETNKGNKIPEWFEEYNLITKEEPYTLKKNNKKASNS